MTGVCSPLRSSMASPYLYSTPIAERTLRQGTPMASGDGQLCEIPAAQGAAGCLELVCLAPGQSDFGSIDISTGKGALGSMHWNVDHCPIAMQLKPAAVDGIGVRRYRRPRCA